MRLLVALFALLLASGCGPSRATTDGSIPGPGDGATDSPLEWCLKQTTTVKLTCAAPNTFEYMVAGTKFRCLGSESFSKPVAWFLFELAGGVKVRALRIGKDLQPHPTDSLVELTAPAPVDLSAMPGAALSWDLRIRPMALAGGLSFVDATVQGVDLKLEPFDDAKLVDTTTVAGTFSFRGGTFVVLDKQGEKQTVQDPDAEGRGCFNVQGKLQPL